MNINKILGIFGALALVALGWEMLSKGSYEPSFSIIHYILLALALSGIIAGLIGNKVDTLATIKETSIAPPDISGLQNIGDPQLTELLIAALYTLNASDISLFELKDDTPTLICTNSSLGTPIPMSFLEDVLRYRHTISTGELSLPQGTIVDSRAVSVMAAPVIDSNVVLGILAISSPKVEAFGAHISHSLEMFASQVARSQSTKRVQAATEDIMQQLRILHDESTSLVATLDLPSLVGAVAEAMQRVDESLEVSILLKTGETYTLMYHGAPIEADRTEYSLEGTLADMAVSDLEHKYFSSLKGYNRPLLPDMEDHHGSAALFPLCFGDEVLGLAVLLSMEPIAPRQIDFLHMLTEQAAISVKNSLFHAEVKRQALTDGLTGLCNHKHFKQILSEEIQNSAQAGEDFRPLTVIMLDIDHFKRVNDTFGHRTGDAVIVGIADMLEDIVRKTDLPARYGGEEFAALLLNTDMDAALILAERLRKTIEETAFIMEDNEINVTSSIGIATLTEDITSAGEIIEQADQALYRAKHSGRNQIQQYTETPTDTTIETPATPGPIYDTPTSIIIEDDEQEEITPELPPPTHTDTIIEADPYMEPEEAEVEEPPLLSSTVGTPREPGIQVHKPRKKRRKQSDEDDELKLF